MARKRKECTIHVTQTSVHDPESVERGLQLWAAYLARHLIHRVGAERKVKRDA